MSLKSYFRKDHKYKTQADLKDMTAEQIVSLNPSDIGFYVETETGGIPLTGVKKRALFNLLARKKLEKKSGINLLAREKIINNFLQREGLDPEVTKLLAETEDIILSERMKKFPEVPRKSIGGKTRIRPNKNKSKRNSRTRRYRIQ